MQADRGETISAGNFHGEYPAKALDYLAIGQCLAALGESLFQMCWFYMGIAQIALVAGNNKSQKGPSLSILEFLFAGAFHVFIHLKI